ncbi:MAG: class I tRNA ligase family protein, partial [Halobacteria archaeon]|nr:class I tRNA ligase family protein [Halobacteria archaeon]
EDASLVIWTTTPWTIPANLYVAVDADLEYEKVVAEKDGDEDILYIASECVEDVLRAGRYDDYQTLETMTGDELVGKKYRHPLEDKVPEQDELDRDGVHEVYTADFVSAERTGLVHSAPGHGVDDFEVGQEYDLPVFSPVAGDGIYTDEAGDYSGKFVRDANDDVI